MRKHHVICRSSKYDEEQSMLVLLCYFKDMGELRFVHMSRNDFHYRGNEVPHIEMHRTAEAFKGKPFWLSIDDDPARNQEASEDPIKLGAEFRDKIIEDLNSVSDGLSDSERRMARRLGDVVEREKKKLSVEQIVENEMSIRAKLGG